MAYVRLFRRVRLAPGVTMNLSKSGPSLSFGVRGAHITAGRRGVTRTVGIPGTGVYWTDRSGRHTGAHTAPHFAEAANPSGQPPKHALSPLGCVLWLIAALVVLGFLGQALGS